MPEKVTLKRLAAMRLLFLTMVFSLAACSGQHAREAESFFYVPTLKQVDPQGGVVRNVFLCGEELVYEVYYDGNGASPARYTYYIQNLMQMDAEPRRISFGFPAGWMGINDMTRDDDGNYYILGQHRNFSVSMGQEGVSPGYCVGIYDADGNMLHLWGIDEWLWKAGSEVQAQNLVLDTRQNIYVIGHEVLLVMNPAGNCQGIFTEAAIYFAACAADGQVYYCCTADMNQHQLKKADPETMQSETIAHDFPVGIGGIPGEDSQLWVFDKNGLYRHGGEEGAAEQLLNWLDVDVDASDLADMTRLSDGRLLLVLYDAQANRMAFKPEDGRSPELVCLERTENDSDGRETVTVGVMNLSDGMREATIRYNRQQSQYRVKLKEYMGINGYETYEEAAAALDRDLVTGKPMDLIAVGYADLDKYTSKGLLEDLTPYLDNSTQLRRENLVDSIVDAYTFDEKLVALPTWFRLETILGRKSMVDERTGWNLSDMILFFDRYQDGHALQSISKEDMLEVCLKFNLSRFVDWENGVCDFEQEDFYQALEFAGRFTGKDSPYGWGSIRREDGRALLMLKWCTMPDFISEMPQWFEGEEICYIGYPTLDGLPGILLETSEDAYGILSDSLRKEAAWNYLEYLILEESKQEMCFSILKDKLDQNLISSMEDPYELDEEGELALDREGKPIRRIIRRDTFIGSDLTIEHYVPLSEEVRQVRELIAQARPAPGYQETVMSIVREEAAGYFAGDKDAGETARIIQNRVWLYLKEKQ